MIFFRHHTFKTFVLAILAELEQKKPSRKDNHAMYGSMNFASKSGMWMEFGVFNGHTLSYMAKFAPGKIIYAFDSFRGLPEKWRDVEYDKTLEKYVSQNSFDRSGLPPVMKYHNIAFIIGLFNETLPTFLKENRHKTVSFLHIDSDLYSSCFFVLDKLKHRLSNNSVIVFDELVNYPDYRVGELRALWDVFHNQRVAVEVVAHSLNKVHDNPKKDTWPQAVGLKLVHVE